jgi:hypothetical protein
MFPPRFQLGVAMKLDHSPSSLPVNEEVMTRRRALTHLICHENCCRALPLELETHGFDPAAFRLLCAQREKQCSDPPEGTDSSRLSAAQSEIWYRGRRSYIAIA